MTATTNETIPEVGWWACTNEEYHADRDSVSHSALERFRESVALYHGLYVAGTIPHPEPTKAMRIGTAVHCMVLEPEEWEKRYALAPSGLNLRTKADRAHMAEFTADVQRNGASIIDADDLATVQTMALAVRDHPMAGKLLEAPGQSECSLRWVDLRTGMPCKARFDRLTDGHVINLKTAADPHPEAFARACANLGYGRGAAYYLDGLWRYAGLRYGAKHEADHLWIVVGSSKPHDVVIYRASEAMLVQGRKENQEDLAELRECYTSGRWESHWPGIQSIDLPRWAQTREG